MKKTMRFLSMATLIIMGILLMGCEEIEENQLPQQQDKTVTMSFAVGFTADNTKALAADGKKTFAKDDQIAVIYKNNDNETIKAISDKLPDGEYGASASFTVTLTNPKPSSDVRYIYPAAMAAATVATTTAVNDDATINYAALETQDGTLATLGKTYDLAIFDGALTAEAALPAGTMDNKLAICAFTILNSDGSSILTSSITGMTISDGTNNYAVTREAAAGPIYVAIRPTTTANISYTATDGTKNYSKYVTGKTYAAEKIYQLGLRMKLLGKFTVNNSGDKVYFSPGNLQYRKSGSTNEWRFAEHQYDYVGEWNTSTWIDLFGWGTWTGFTYSGGFMGPTSLNPTKTSVEDAEYTWNSYDFQKESELIDASQRGYDWRTLSKEEWAYVLNTRTPNAHYAMATVNGKAGMILFPDTYSHPAGVTAPASINTANAAFTANSYSAENWSKMEAAGCAFLPAAGFRSTTTMDFCGDAICYWSSSPDDSSTAYGVLSAPGYETPLNVVDQIYRSNGYSVRLVRNVNP